MIHFDRFSYRYPDVEAWILRDMALSIEEGEFLLVMGPSGAGKSTLLRCLNGLVPHFYGGQVAGAVRVDGRDPVAVGPRGMADLVGFVLQDPEAQFVVDKVAMTLEEAFAAVDDCFEGAFGEAGAEVAALTRAVIACLRCRRGPGSSRRQRPG